MFYDYSTKDALNVTGKGSKKGAKIFKRKLRSLLVFTIAFVMALSPLFSSGPISFAADSYPVVLGFTSDVHQNNTNLTQWLTSIKNKGIELDRMTFGGDYNVGYSGDAEAITTRNAASAVLGSEVPITLVRGNHETTDSSLFAKGLVYNGEAYAMFALDTSGESFLDSDMTALSNALASIPSSKPVFVMTHRPIHYYGMRTTLKASQMINLLNDYENVIFLWGHNHTVGDSNYGVIKYKGDTVQTTNNGAQEEIKFTYLSFGAMKDGNNSAYGLVVTLNKVGNDTKVDFSYRDLQGNQQQTGSVTISGSGGSGPSEPGGVAGYELVSEPVSGETYVVVAKSGSTSYALSAEKFTSGSNDYLKAEQVTVVGDKVLSSDVDSTMLWKFIAHGDPVKKGFNVINEGNKYLYRAAQGAVGIYTNSDGDNAGYADWIYDSSKKTLRLESTQVSDKFYLQLNIEGSNQYFANIKNNEENEIFLYKLTGEVGESSGPKEPEGPSGPVGPAEYELVSEPVSGETYVVVAKSGSTSYALSAEKFTSGSTDYLKAEQVTVVGDKVLSSDVDSTMLWKFIAHGDPVKKGFNVINEGNKYLYRAAQGAVGIYTNSNGDNAGYADWIYDSSKKTLRLESTQVSDKFYLQLNIEGSNQYFANIKNNEENEIFLYKLTEGAGEPEEPSGPQEPEQPGGAAGYELVSEPVSGETYVVVAKSGSTSYALSTEKFTSGSNDYLRGKQVTVVGDQVLASTVDSSMLWKFNYHNKGFNVLNGSSNFLYRKDQGGEGIYINGDGSDDNYADWIYNSSEKSLRAETTNVTTDNIFYILLGNSGSNFYFSNNKTSKSEIFLYKLTDGIEPPEEPEEPSGPEEPEGPAEPGENAGYELVSSPENGETYVVVAKSGSTNYALSTEKFTSGSNDYLRGKQVTVVEDKVLANTVDSSMLWKFVNHAKGFNVLNGSSNFLYRKNQGGEGIYINGDGSDDNYADWIYNSAEKSLRSETTNVSTDNIFYILLGNSGSNFYFSNNLSSKSEIFLYKLIEIEQPEEEEPEEEEPEEEQPEEEQPEEEQPEEEQPEEEEPEEEEPEEEEPEEEQPEEEEPEEEEPEEEEPEEEEPEEEQPEEEEPEEEQPEEEQPEEEQPEEEEPEEEQPEEEQPEEEQPEEEEPEEEQPKDETPQPSSGGGGGGRVRGVTDEVADEPVPEAVPYKGFSDVKEDDWFFEAVKFVNERELFKGVSNELFAPNVNITRGMFVTILSRFEFGNDESVPQGESPFEDLTQDWYKNAVAWAFANEITLGVSETNFAPDQILTREQMVTLIFRYAEMKGFDIGFEQEAAEIFEDFVSINEYAKPAMLWAFKHGLLVDINAESLIFNPQNNASRALSADIFMRFYKETLEP